MAIMTSDKVDFLPFAPTNKDTKWVQGPSLSEKAHLDPSPGMPQTSNKKNVKCLLLLCHYWLICTDVGSVLTLE